jgi:uncharacterized protein YkwD
VENQLLEELNFARTQPQAYAQRLLLQPITDWEEQLDPEERALDAGAFAEAVEFLMHQQPLNPLRADDTLAAAALDHVARQGASGDVGHEGGEGEPMENRLRRHGVRRSWTAENIAYGPRTPQDVVRELIIDQGVPDRGHRVNIFTPQLTEAGVGCGPHVDYDFMCVIDFGSPPYAKARQTAGATPAPGVEARLERAAQPGR